MAQDSGTDGNIKLGLDIETDTKGLSKTINHIQKEVLQLTAALASTTQGRDFLRWFVKDGKDASQSMTIMANLLEQLGNKFTEMGGKESEVTKQAQNLQAVFNTVSQAVGQATDTASRWRDSISDVVKEFIEYQRASSASQQAQGPQQESTRLQDLLDVYRDLENHLKAMNKGDVPFTDIQYSETIQAIHELRQQIEALRRELENTDDDTERSSTSWLSWSKILQTVGAIGKKSFKGLLNVQKGALTGLVNFGKKGLKSITKFTKGMLGIRSAFMLFRKLRAMATEAFQALAQQIPFFNDQMSGFQTAWVGLKGAVGSAVQPLVSAVLPILTQVIQVLTQATQKVAEFFAAFTGQGVVYKATARQQQFAKSVGSGAKAMEGALGAYDKLNVIQDKSGSGAGSTGALDVDYEPEVIESKMQDLVNLVKQSWANADFTEIGAMLGTKLRDVLTFVNTSIIPVADGVGIQLAKSLATGLNGVFTVEGLGTELGTTIDGAFNVALHFVETFIQEFDWEQFGVQIGNALYSLVTDIDWASLGTIFFDSFGAIFDTITGMILGIDWYQLAVDVVNTIVDFIVNYDWGGLVASGEKMIGSILGGLASACVGLGKALWDLLKKAWDEAVEYFKGKTDEYGGDVIAGFFDGIIDAIAGIGDWIVEHIFKPFFEGFKSAFKINSPSKVMEEQGNFIIDGLKQGLLGLWDKVKEIFNNFKTKVSESFTNVKDKIMAIWDNIKSALGNKVTAIKDSVINVFTSLKEKVGSIFEGIWSKIKPVINTILSGVEKMSNGLISGINSMIRALNRLDFDIPSWVPLLGGKSFGLNIPTISSISIPKLAQGAVIPPNKEFLAQLGDQRHGVNIEAPLDTIKQAVKEVLGEGGLGNQPIILQLDGKVVAKVVWDENEKRYKQLGYKFSY